jgi:hypothetical protein
MDDADYHIHPEKVDGKYGCYMLLPRKRLENSRKCGLAASKVTV